MAMCRIPHQLEEVFIGVNEILRESKSLLLVAHGSRLAASNDEVRQLTATLAVKLKECFSLVDCAFLELGEPSIPDTIDAQIKKGSNSIVVFPYFLAAGRHVVKDIPAVVEEKRRQHPHVTFEITPHLGAAKELLDALTAFLR